jgi:NADP-dependent 3-hydroxy acid dehydrogenase YdfG
LESLFFEATMKPPYPAPINEWHNDTYPAINPRRPELSQAGKSIVITGAGSGIGREIAHAFAQAGAHSIHILGRTKQPLEETKALVEAQYQNSNIVVHVADILDSTALGKAAQRIGEWDVLVANAGYIPKPALIEASDPDEWWKTFEVFCSSHCT